MRREILLASSSPRRALLLRAAGFAPEIVAPHADESWPPDLQPQQAVLTLARRKLARVALCPERLALAADTVVVLDGRVLGKPADAAAAAATLRHLSGRAHAVYTGFVMRLNNAEHAETVCTEVSFRHLSEAEVEAYVASGESLDKAGAYGIQGGGGALVDRLSGSYTNVVGLPLAEVVAAAQRLERGA